MAAPPAGKLLSTVFNSLEARGAGLDFFEAACRSGKPHLITRYIAERLIASNEPRIYPVFYVGDRPRCLVHQRMKSKSGADALTMVIGTDRGVFAWVCTSPQGQPVFSLTAQTGPIICIPVETGAEAAQQQQGGDEIEDILRSAGIK